MPSSPTTLPPRRPRSRRPGRTILGAVAIGVALLAGGAPLAVVAQPTSEPDAASPIASPTVEYLEAQAHAADRTPFAAGHRVTVPFSPRRSDRWSIAGAPPTALPTGRASGRQMRDPKRPLDPAMTPGTPGVPGTAGTPGGSGSALQPGAPIGAVDVPTVRPEAAPAAELAAAVDPGGLKREVFGFLPYWELTDSSTRLDWEKLSTIAYFGVGASAAGDLIRTAPDGSTDIGWAGWTSAKMTGVIDTAHRNGTRVVLTVQSFAWTSSGTARQRALLGSATARLRLARQIAAALRDRGADGVNLDFEPIVATYADEFTAFVRTLRTELDRVARGYQLTFDATGWIGNYPIEKATARGGADAIVIMGYDYRTASSERVGSLAPLAGTTYDIRDTLLAFTARVPAAKLILGVPYYGRAWSTDTSLLGAANISSAKYGSSTTVTYVVARQYAADHGLRYDPVERVAWTTYKRRNCTATYGCVTPWRQLYFDDTRALAAKYDLVNAFGLRGAGIWALGYDGTRTELYQVLKDKFITDTVPPRITGSSVSTAVLSPNGDGRLDTVTVKVAVSGLIRWGWVVSPVVGGVVGSPVRTGSVTGKTVAYTWDGRRTDGTLARDGTYQVMVWTADASDNRASVRYQVAVDTRRPVLTTAAGPSWFSPDGDGRTDTTRLSMTADSPVTGVAQVIGPSGVVVRRWTVPAGMGSSLPWNGRDSAGRLVRDGRYDYRITTYDRAGNKAVADTPIRVDRTIGAVGWRYASFVPRKGGVDRFGFTLRRAATADLAIYRGSILIRQVFVGRSLAAGIHRWTWDGRTASGALVPAGTYQVVLTATSWVGPSAVGSTVTVRVP